jgi:4-hydroxy-3-methylbut-2-enyl diphosphate reductase
MAEAELDSLGCGDGTSVRRVYSLGPLIHNPQTLASLEKRGIVILGEDEITERLFPDKPDKKAENAVIIIRAHGISPAVENVLSKSGVRIVDATCPKVKASQNTAGTLSEKGYVVFIAGERNHAEVKGIAGYVEAAGGAPVIVGGEDEAEEAALTLYRQSPRAKTAIIAQTTLSVGEYTAIAEVVKKFFPDTEVKDTICGATRERQDALRELCAVCDLIVVAGGKESANTRRLFAIARQCAKPCILAEKAADLDAALGEYGEACIGLCAGASTPDAVIEEIEQACGSLS